MWFVYILKCRDGSLYTGITDDVEKRFRAHREGKGGRYTRSHAPVRIVYREPLRSRSLALRREMAIKRLPRAKKLKLIQLY